MGIKMPRYTVHPSVAYARVIIENLPVKTGRSLDEWSELLKRDGPSNLKEQRAWLKTSHGLGGTTAALVASAAGGESPEDFDESRYFERADTYVQEMYAAKREILRPIHDELMLASVQLGPDIKISPCKTMVPVYRNHVIAQIKPATATRIDFGLALKGHTESLPERLIDTGGLEKKDRITHRFPITAVEEIDDEVKHWLSVAYELDA